MTEAKKKEQSGQTKPRKTQSRQAQSCQTHPKQAQSGQTQPGQKKPGQTLTPQALKLKKEKKPKSDEEIREAKIEEAFVRAVQAVGGMALKFTSQSMNGVPDRLILLKIGKCAFVELKAPGKQMRPLQRKRRKQLEALGFPVFCVDDFDQIEPVVKALEKWNPGEPFPTGVGAVIPEIKETVLPGEMVMPGETGASVSPGETEKTGETEAPSTEPPDEMKEDPQFTQLDKPSSQGEEVMPHEVHTA